MVIFKKWRSMCLGLILMALKIWMRPIFFLIFSSYQLINCSTTNLATGLPLVCKFKFVRYGHIKKKLRTATYTAAVCKFRGGQFFI